MIINISWAVIFHCPSSSPSGGLARKLLAGPSCSIETAQHLLFAGGSSKAEYSSTAWPLPAPVPESCLVGLASRAVHPVTFSPHPF